MSKNNDLEAQLKRLYTYIKEYVINNGYSPNVREMCVKMNVTSTSTISYYLKKLEEKNLISRKKGQKRAIELLGEAEQSIRNRNLILDIPYLGDVAGGNPILAEENAIDTFSISPNMFGVNEKLFVLKVAGDSMIDAGILDGDFVVIQPKNTAENGEIVVVRTENGNTVKKFYKENKKIRLQPCNSSMQPFYFDNVEIIGKVIASYRTY